MTVRAKLVLSEVTELMWGGAKRLKFTTQYDNSIPDDLRFQKATPTGAFEMQVDNPVAMAQFKLGTAYYVDFNPVPEKAA